MSNSRLFIANAILVEFDKAFTYSSLSSNDLIHLREWLSRTLTNQAKENHRYDLVWQKDLQSWVPARFLFYITRATEEWRFLYVHNHGCNGEKSMATRAKILANLKAEQIWLKQLETKLWRTKPIL